MSDYLDSVHDLFHPDPYAHSVGTERHCVDCGAPFEPVSEHDRRCKWCNAAKHGF